MIVNVTKGETMNDLGQEKYYRRAMAAYFRAGGSAQPSSSSSEWELNGRHYVVLENVNGVLAVYRVKNDGFLRRLRRWPKELEPES